MGSFSFLLITLWLTTESGGAFPPDCYITNIGQKCGTDIILSSGSCGPTVPCVFQQDIFDHLWNCVGTTAGLTECTTKVCNKTTIRRKCENNNCILDGEPNVTPEATGTQASGERCPPT